MGLGVPVPRGVKLTRTLVSYLSTKCPSLIPALIIWATSTTKNKIHLALLPERKGAAVSMGIGRIIWVWWLSNSPIFSCGTWLRGTSVRVNLTPRGTRLANLLEVLQVVRPAHPSAGFMLCHRIELQRGVARQVL